MSHTTTIKLEIKSLSALTKACEETKTPYQQNADVRMYDGDVIKDCFSFTPRGWRYPVAAKNGQLKYDNYGGAWGADERLDEIKQRYAVNVQKEAAGARGYRCTETRLSDGSVRLTVER